MRNLLLTIPLIFVLSNVSWADDTGHIKLFVDKIADRIINTIESKQNDKQIKSKLTQVFLEVVDVDWIGRFVLGANWRTLDRDQQNKYLQNYKEYIIGNYVDRFTEYNGQKYHISDVESLGRGYYIVHMEILQSNSNINVAYRIKKHDNNVLKIRDIVIEDTSLLATQRSEFTSYVTRNGIESLIKLLADKTKKGEPLSPSEP